MYFCHSAKIWAQFPQLVPGLLVVDHVHPQVEVEQQLQPWYEQARVRLSRSSESQMAEIAAWRREDDLPRLHPLVDLCNAVSVAFALPVAVFDLAKVDSFLEVRHATGSEQYLAFSEAIEHPAPNEVIFSDAANQVHARRWTFRQSRRSVISAETGRALIVSEGLHETAASEVRSLIDSLAIEITALWSAPQLRAILQATAPRLDFE
jgi:DNA/RNA-binding domain of Phe-tRNA-synthetase-like protein